MYKVVLLLVITGVLFYGLYEAYGQEPQLATFQETAQVLIDKQLSNNVSAAISLQSTSNQEIRIPSELERKIRENDRIVSVVLTNQESCILGVFDQSCILVNVSRDQAEKGIVAIQEAAKKIGNSVIDDINQVFDTNAKFHSVFVHQGDETGQALETSGVVSGRGTVSTVYIIPKEDTDSMYEKISSILIPSIIRESEGFFDVAKNLSKEPTAAMTFSIIPQDNASLYQLKVSVDYPNLATSVNTVSPLEFLKADRLKRSNYFSQGFYPLNSILQVVVLSSEPTSIIDVKGNLIPTQIVGGEKIPADLSSDGWIFDPESGDTIDGKYLFGKKNSVSKNELIFVLDSEDDITTPVATTNFDESIIIVIIIVIIAGAAAVYYMKGYRK